MSVEEATRQFEQFLAQVQSGGLGGTAANPYAEWRKEFFDVDKLVRQGTEAASHIFSVFGAEGPGLPEAKKEDEPYQVSATGKVMYENGVIFDPESGQYLTPPGKAVPGSKEWLLKIQDEWSNKEANSWRKKLSKQGYQVAESGGMGWDLIEALGEFHARRYSNFGKVQPLIPQAGQEDTIRGAIDKVALRQEIKTWGQVPFGEDLEDAEADWFTDRIISVASRLARKKGWTPEQALAGAQARVQEEFVEKPQVKALMQEQEDQEVSYKIRDAIVGVNQLLGA